MTPPPTTPGESTPAYSHDHSFTLQAIMEMQRTLGGVVKQIEAVERSVSKMADDVAKHGRWMFAANVVALLGLAVIGFLAKMLWDIAKAKLGVP